MKILYISTSPLEYSASSNMRNVALLKGLIENGHKIYTLTPEAQKDSNLYDDKLCNIKIEKKYYIGMGKIHSAVTVKKNSNKSLKNKLKNYLYNKLKKIRVYDFRSSLAKQKIIINDSFDVVISSSDPKSSHLMAKRIIDLNPQITKRWIQYWGDPFADDINDNRKLFKFFVKKEEEKLIRYSDEIVYVSPFTLKKQQELYPKYKDKMYFLPIPYNEEVIYNTKKKNKNLTIGYFGNYYEKNRNILPLYNFVRKHTDYRLMICGGTDVNLKQEDNIVIEERQSIQKIREYEEQSDILVCICNSSGTQIPGKVYHYSATNKPILVVLDGEYQEELKKYFESFNRYILCYNNKESIEKALEAVENYDINVPCKSLSAKYIAKKFINKGEKKYESD